MSNKPELKKFKTNGDPRCQTLIKRGTRKPGIFKQCISSVANNKNKYCEKHNSPVQYSSK